MISGTKLENIIENKSMKTSILILIMSVFSLHLTYGFTDNAKGDTLKFFYTNGEISVKMHPWVEQQRAIELFDTNGFLTYSTIDMHLANSIRNEFFFHENGSVSKIIEHNNPGASKEMYEATMTFSKTNEPLQRINSIIPSDAEPIAKQKRMYWNNVKKQWNFSDSPEKQERKVLTGTPKNLEKK